MIFNRRKFIASSLVGGLATAIPHAACGLEHTENANPAYSKLDEILKKPVLKKELFTSPVIIETLELLRFKNSFLW